jgi:hypothetical protein
MSNALDNDYKDEEVKGMDIDEGINQIWLMLQNEVVPEEVADESIPLGNVVDFSTAKLLSGIINTIADNAEIGTVKTTGGNILYKLSLPIEDKGALDNICNYIKLNTNNLPKDKPKQPLTSDVFSKCEGVRPIDCEYLAPLNKNNGLYEIVLASNKLDMQHLLYLTSAYIAVGMKGKKLEEICDYLTPEKQVEEVKDDA